MITVRPSTERGLSRLDWLDSRHTFSFDQYYDPDHMGYGPLRVINEDFIAPGGGFGMHPHRDMEIITYVIEGQLEHRDSLGNGSVISPGEIQKMSAGTGIMHSEYNASGEKRVHLLQIWIRPDKSGLKPGYEQEKFELTPGEWKLLGSPDGNGLVSIHQRAKLYALSAVAGSKTSFSPEANAKLWLQVVKGKIAVGGETAGPGDALAITADGRLQVSAAENAELLLFELT